MKVFLLVILIAASSYAQGTAESRPQITLDQALSKQQIDSVLKNVVATALPEIRETFLVTDQSLTGLESSAVSTSFSKSLKSLKGQEIVGREKFIVTLAVTAEKDDARKYQALAAFYTRSTVVVTDDFYSRIQELVEKARPPEKANAHKWLEDGFKQFVSEYAAFLRRNSPDKNTVVLGDKLEEFLEVAASGCGRNPCAVPPCCGKLEDYCGNPCKDK